MIDGDQRTLDDDARATLIVLLLWPRMMQPLARARALVLRVVSTKRTNEFCRKPKMVDSNQNDHSIIIDAIILYGSRCFARNEITYHEDGSRCRLFVSRPQTASGENQQPCPHQ